MLKNSTYYPVSSGLQMQEAKSTTNRLTLRLQTDLFEFLKEDAQRKDLTVNSLISKILNQNTTYDNNVNVVQCVTMPHDLFIDIINRLSLNDIYEIGERGPSVVKRIFDILGIEYDLEHVSDNYFMILGKYCGWFEFTHKERFGTHRFVFSTGKDPKWSVFVHAYVKNILDSLKIIPISDSERDGVVVFEFSYKNSSLKQALVM